MQLGRDKGCVNHQAVFSFGFSIVVDLRRGESLEFFKACLSVLDGHDCRLFLPGDRDLKAAFLITVDCASPR